MSDKKVFLFVDDSRVSRMKIKQLAGIKRPDLELVEASSGEDALVQVDSIKPDLISMDINMPGMDGMEAVRQLRLKCPEAKIVMLSGNIQDDMKEQAAALGVGFVEKPITDECIGRVLSYLG